MTRLKTLAALAAGLWMMQSPAPASAVVYCKTVGVPKGCVARPVAPVARAIVYCTSPGLPVGCVARPGAVVVAPGVGAPGVGVRPGTPMNRGGPVNRVGRF